MEVGGFVLGERGKSIANKTFWGVVSCDESGACEAQAGIVNYLDATPLMQRQAVHHSRQKPAS